MSIAIRPALRSDVATIIELIRDLAIYEREPAAAIATESDLLRDGFGDGAHGEDRAAGAERGPAVPSGSAEADPGPSAAGRPVAFHVLLAEEDGVSIGFALYFFTYSTWRGRRCLYLEDLFVRPEHRGRGAGIALMRALARVALREECARFVWQVLDWNEPSIDFYERLGARIERQWLHVRLEGEPLVKLGAL